jgi:transposase, IS5 family
MRCCWLKGQTGDALHAVLCAVGYNLRWLLRAIVRLGIKPVLFALALLVQRLFVDFTTMMLHSHPSRGFLQSR